MVPFVNSFLSYLLLYVIMVLIAGAGIFIGMVLRKKKEQKTEVQAESTSE